MIRQSEVLTYLDQLRQDGKTELLMEIIVEAYDNCGCTLQTIKEAHDDFVSDHELFNQQINEMLADENPRKIRLVSAIVNRLVRKQEQG
jgi:hypothetical protein